jgi:hypothetical protein
VLEIVRPGMEDSESAEKQENTGIGPASACRGEKRVHACLSRAMARPTGAYRSTRTFLGAQPTPRFGVSEARMQNPGRKHTPRE